MTYSKAQSILGARGLISVQKSPGNVLDVEVIVKEYKDNSYGHKRYLVSPVAGQREIWVQKITFLKQK